MLLYIVQDKAKKLVRKSIFRRIFTTIHIMNSWNLILTKLITRQFRYFLCMKFNHYVFSSQHFTNYVSLINQWTVSSCSNHHIILYCFIFIRRKSRMKIHVSHVYLRTITKQRRVIRDMRLIVIQYLHHTTVWPKSL